VQTADDNLWRWVKRARRWLPVLRFGLLCSQHRVKRGETYEESSTFAPIYHGANDVEKLGKGEGIHLKKVSDIALHCSLVPENIVSVLAKFSTGTESCYEVLRDMDLEPFICCKLLFTQTAYHIAGH